MVFRRRSQNALRPVNRIKHVVDGQFGVVIATTTFTNLVLTVDAPVLANTNEVVTGSTINGIFLTVEVTAESAAALSNAYMYVVVSPGGTLTLPDPNAVGAFQEKRFVIHQEMVMLQKVDPSNPRTLFKGVIAIPRHLRRMSPNTRVILAVFSPGITLNACFQCHYKEFR